MHTLTSLCPCQTKRSIALPSFLTRAQLHSNDWQDEKILLSVSSRGARSFVSVRRDSVQ